MRLLTTFNPASPRPVGRRRMARAAGTRGFTTLEVAMVLPLVGILAFVGLTNLRQALAREESDGWARSMTYDIAAGRQAAMTRRTTVTVSMSDGQGNNASAEHPGTVYTIGAGGVGTLRQGTLPSHMTMTTTCSASACSFDRRGVPITSGTITITSASTGRTFTITIDSSTGRVSYSEP